MIVTFDAALLDEGKSDHLYVGLSKYGAGDMLTDQYILDQGSNSYDVMTHPIDQFKARQEAKERRQRMFTDYSMFLILACLIVCVCAFMVYRAKKGQSVPMAGRRRSSTGSFTSLEGQRRSSDLA